MLNIKSTKKTSNVNSNKQIDNLNKQKKDSNNESNENAESKNSNNNNQIETQKKYVDESYVCPEGLEMLFDFIGYRGVFGPNNMLDDKDIRIQYIQFLLMNENKVTWTTEAYQSFPYINEWSFVNKYNEIFDSAKYNYVNNQDSTKFIDCNNYEETKNKNYKCWNGT